MWARNRPSQGLFSVYEPGQPACGLGIGPLRDSSQCYEPGQPASPPFPLSNFDVLIWESGLAKNRDLGNRAVTGMKLERSRLVDLSNPYS